MRNASCGFCDCRLSKTVLYCFCCFGGKALHIRQAVGLHFPKGGEAMRITFHIGEFTITIIVKKR